MLPPDNHVHSEWSYDTPAESSMEGACRRAVQTGLPGIAFTEHLDFNDWAPLDPGAASQSGEVLDLTTYRRHAAAVDVEGYQASISHCRDMFPDLRILSGLETGEAHLFGAQVAAVLGSATFDRVLGSLHGVRHEGRLVDADQLFHLMPAPEVMRAYLAEIVRLVEGSDVFQVLAHADFPRRYWPRSAGPFEEKVFEEEYRQVFRALAGSDRALEINTRSPMWSSTLMRWWYEEGGSAVSFGSDAHVAGRVGEHFAVARDVVEAAGFRAGRDPWDFWRR